MKKKLIFVSLALIVMLCACTRKEFVNKLCGTWKISKYLYAGQDKTAAFDTTNYLYQLQINQNYTFVESYTAYYYNPDSTITSDTTLDTATMVYTITHDTSRFINVVKVPYSGNGTWSLINSEEDLELRNNGASDSTARILNILKLSKGNLNLLNGNKEYDLTH